MQNRPTMFRLADVELFSSLDGAELDALEQAFERRQLSAGTTVCRRGEAGRALYVIAQGGVEIEIIPGSSGAASRVHLGPGQVFGEMALLSGQPVSATVVTIRDSSLWVLDKDRFAALFEANARLLTPFLRLLTERLRHRSQLSTGRPTGRCALIVSPDDTQQASTFRRALLDALARYAPASIVIAAHDDEAPTHGAAPPWPGEWGGAPQAVADFELPLAMQALRVWSSDQWFADLIGRWRVTGSLGRYLLLLVSAARAERLKPALALGDAVLWSLPPAGATGSAAPPPAPDGLADEASFRIATSRDADQGERPWYFLITPDELDANPAPRRSTLDHIARWLTHREVAIAMGAGAARGFAHLGVLQVLDEAGVPIDFACGTSMGGAVALSYAHFGSALAATETVRDVAGSNDKVIDLAWLPGASMLRGKKVRRFVDRLLGDASFDRFGIPAAVVAADLVRGERHVFDRGPAAVALLATTAIPGLFPPVRHDGRIFVDGAVVSRIPFDLVHRRRCGLTIAVNVIPSVGQRSAAAASRAQGLSDKFDRFMGLRHVIAGSWELLAWWHGAAEALAADFLIEPATDADSAYAFGSIDRMVEAGRVAARAKAPAIVRAVTELLRPGVP
jgi:NTE family protein